MQRVSWFAVVIAFGIVLNNSPVGAENQEATSPPSEKSDADPNSADREALLKQLRTKADRLRELYRAGNKEQAAELREEVRVLAAKVQKLLPPGTQLLFKDGLDGRPAGDAESLERRKLLRELMQTYRQFRELKQAGDEEAAAKVKEKLSELRKRVAEFGPAGLMMLDGPVDAAPRLQGAAGEQIRKRLVELREQMAAAQQAGDQEKVAALKREARQLAEKAKLAVAGRPAAGRRAVRPFPVPAAQMPDKAGGEARSLQQRIQHLRIAAANLEAAGMKDYAAKVRAEGERWMQRVRQQQDDSAAGNQIRQLTEQVRRLTAEVEQLKQRVQKLSEQD